VSLTAVGRSIDVGLAADAASCVRAATLLATLAETCEQAALVLGRHAQLGEAAFGGLSGIVYRSSSTLLEQACGRTGGRSRRLAEGLAAYAQGMTEVRRRLDEAVAVAAPHLDVTGGRIWSPPRPAGPDDPDDPDDAVTAQGWAAWRDAVDRWRAARELEDRVSQEWVRVLDRPVLFEGGDR
jgi:hypothetical protein